MPRARNIKPGFFESEDPAKVGYPQRLLWIALWTLADREGRLPNGRRYVMSQTPSDGRAGRNQAAVLKRLMRAK